MEKKHETQLPVELYKRIIDDSYDAICVSDKKGRFVLANKATQESMQLSEAAILGKYPEQLNEKHVYSGSTIMEAIRTKKVVTGLVNVRGVNRLSTSIPLFNEDGDFDYVVTNNRSDSIIDEFSKQLAYEKERHAHFKEIVDYFSKPKAIQEIIAKSPGMIKVLHDCLTIAASDSRVMILGESGSGKELIANYIHRNSPRKDNAFIAVNCSTIPSELFESEFFGYRPGAFTGANTKGKTGFLQMAHRGTLFLDELAELPLAMQAKLLRFTETGEFYPVGSSKPEKVDVRIVTATNQNLPNLIRDGAFRNDLYYRLSIFPIQLPPLRERLEDIEAIALHYMDVYNKKYHKETFLSSRNLDVLTAYPWPGNIRELRNIIERAVLMAPNKKTDLNLASVLQETVDSSSAPVSPAFMPGTLALPSLDLPLGEALKQLEQQYINAVIEHHDGSLTRAAKSLQVHRTTLYRKMH